MAAYQGCVHSCVCLYGFDTVLTVNPLNLHFLIISVKDELATAFNELRARSCVARHGVKLGGASPLRAELRRFVSLGKGVHREVESEGS